MVASAVIAAVAFLVGALTWAVAMSRPSANIERFSRAVVGCTTTVEFAVTGTYFVFQERSELGEVPTGCAPTAVPEGDFSVELVDGDRPVAIRDDRSMSYRVAGSEADRARSIARFEIDRIGRYEIVVAGPETDVVAAIGRDPARGVDELRLLAVALAASGLVAAGVVLAAGRVTGPRERPEVDRDPASGATGWAPPSGPPLG